MIRDMNSPESLPRIHLLATGGTIAGAHTDGRGYTAAALTAEALVAAVPQLGGLARITTEQVAGIASQDMDEAVWARLAAQARAAVADPAVAGVVITHGTDTMEETAFFLNLVLPTAKPVVLVGAMRPATAISADGPMNLYNAVAVAVHPGAAGRGVLVTANDEVHFAREVTKTNTTQLATFRSPNRGLAGLVNAGRVHWFGPAPRRHTAASEFAAAAVEALPRVEILHAHAGMGRRMIDLAVRDGAAGLVIAGVGNGNFSTSALTACREAVRAGVAVVRSSRTGGGVVERDIEVDDGACGFIAAEELNPQKARVLLMLGLARTREVASLQTLFTTY